MWDTYWADRGKPWEYDPGPSDDWAKLFARTPHYRRIGKQRIGREAFRWHFGPMFYRGRLEPNAAKVLVIGQEGAQDESLAHRSFVGGSGSKMQNFLSWIGISRSYLFMNTFCYPIYGQYVQDLKWLAQNDDSPIAQHRHELFERVASTNSLQLVVAVGTAAKEAVATWRRMRGGNLPAGTKSIHVLHPGAAAAGSASSVRTSFVRAVNQIARWAGDEPGWLPPDPDAARRFDETFKFRNAPIPFRDLPFGVAWRLGHGGTSSNRRDAQEAIQLFSADGRYNGTGHAVTYGGNAGGSKEGYAEDSGDLAYEPPKDDFGEFDRGPGAALSRLLMGGEAGFEWPDFAVLGLPCHPSLGYGPILRGRPGSAAVVVLADQDSQDDLFTARAYTGDGGQRFQKFLAAAGLARSYAILRVLPVNIRGATEAKLRAAIDHPQVQRLYREILSRVQAPRALLAIGPWSRRLAANVAPAGLRLIEMKSTLESGWQADWQQALQKLASVTYPRDHGASFSYDGSRGQIARLDLPYGTLRWQASSGDRALQAKRSGKPSRDYFKLAMPKWAAALKA
jgi:uracil-DNA glycosylase